MERRSSENQLALGLILLGALTMAVSAFLPLDQPSGPFASVQSNSLVQQGGWALIILAVGIAASGFRVAQGSQKKWIPILLCVIAAASTIGIATKKSYRTLYPIGSDGQADTSHPGTVVPLGVAPYVEGTGVALALIGSLMLTRRGALRGDDQVSESLPATSTAEPETQTKKCPDCAETVLAEARVCKHCGYRFT